MEERFRLYTVKEAKALNLPEAEDFGSFGDYRGLLYDFEDPDQPKLLHADGGEPEDQTFCRDWSWVVPLLNSLSSN